jgi:hypothetical protein
MNETTLNEYAEFYSSNESRILKVSEFLKVGDEIIAAAWYCKLHNYNFDEFWSYGYGSPVDSADKCMATVWLELGDY